MGRWVPPHESVATRHSAPGPLAGMTASLSGCERITSEISNRMDSGIPEYLPNDLAAVTIDPIFHLLSRAG